VLALVVWRAAASAARAFTMVRRVPFSILAKDLLGFQRSSYYRGDLRLAA
jgi:hypothetical protein